MRTTLTPDHRKRFALLLFAAMGVTFVLTALFDALAPRRRGRHAHHEPPTALPTRPARGLGTKEHRAPVPSKRPVDPIAGVLVRH
ncbi:hypothetical protein OG250_38935 [Streptomyces sp. NBC_00487]|uniref:hypothetical protein n=1 Tax=unclassified Streptomyces TaxID=2593676 RepID=UPI002E18D1AD|nr:MULTISPECIES: hypothetical protein [unclassified Streptomyces]